MRIKIGDEFRYRGKHLKVCDIKYIPLYGEKCLVIDIVIASNKFIPIDCMLYNEFLEAKKTPNILYKDIIFINPIIEKIKKLLL